VADETLVSPRHRHAREVVAQRRGGGTGGEEGRGHLTCDCEWPRAAEGEGNEEGMGARA